ncbi:MAG: signal peptidase I [Cellulomonas sp. 73-92]|nr:MAG: signal peptidase I [Cellulomonas sp. 73-92]
MMRGIRFVGNALLWVVAALGLVSMLVWGATQLGYIKPLVVISGSMQPGIMTGDLLVDAPHPTADLQVGQVASLPSDVTHNLVSHRVVGIEPAGDGHWSVRLKGDANRSEDGGAYLVGDHVWQPVLRIPHGGYVVTAITRRAIALPLGFALVCLLSLSLLPTTPRERSRGRHRDVPVGANGRTTA